MAGLLLPTVTASISSTLTCYLLLLSTEYWELRAWKLELKPPSGRVLFSRALWWAEWSRHPQRPMMLLYLLPLSRQASSQMLTASLPSQCHVTTPPMTTQTCSPLAIPNQLPLASYTYVDHLVDWRDISCLPVRLSRFTCYTLISRFQKKKKENLDLQ